ncbi:TRAP transporter substrate-binding protein [Sulfitobacter mediterraneus]|jgi:TRAP-type C4-dicarboxylate transport system substrate-binding protein|uniref:TRAP-type C4-dicarboxylate transport system substrate-binding protein n=1 Tax=Sulfitobacter mediterraneus TaxID=83219 RepID=A0A2T6CJI6_9RHOB|nr:TRAP transporter substrate-binding protein [Sulfitobacter mediterraneus]KIN78646.1 Peptide ABC transporter, solute-binding protein [Sulfitobacter mediterraneus KCTC 32188]MBM1310270.1 TRAP transporter substrate-binding protein [Sulfitobacter mediterraneus]MBM1314154.1 TRAP transporter substrate-binding protein [Sulfitobacter mediterraneus]MBM1322514.1 TRAP transporter substrate-binding protein [Sulfitobacter mediterraneus]MBM1326426.1 TRAP transporter substrate-binding protein [Sulfitobacte
MKLTTKLMAGVATAAVTLTAAMPAMASEKWDMPMAYSASNFHSENGVAFADCVRGATNGDIDITVHPGGSLFAGADIKRAIQTGQVQIGERLLSGHQNENAVFGFDSVPFLAPSFDDSAKLFKAAKPKLDAVLDEQNLVMLYAVPWPPQGLYFNKEVNSAADMQGIKFRSYNNATARLAELTGMLPVTIEAAEISQAFATGVAESMISSGATGYDRKVWESLSHFYEVDAWLPYNYVMVNKGVWADVSDANKTAITTCAGEAQARGLQASKDYTQFTMDGLAAGGMTVGPAGDQLMGDLRAVGETMTAEWLEAAGDDGAAIVDGFKSMK